MILEELRIRLEALLHRSRRVGEHPRLEIRAHLVGAAGVERLDVLPGNVSGVRVRNRNRRGVAVRCAMNKAPERSQWAAVCAGSVASLRVGGGSRAFRIREILPVTERYAADQLHLAVRCVPDDGRLALGDITR